MITNKKAMIAGISSPLILGVAMLISTPVFADGHCVAYAAATEGGEGGFRIMDNKDSFRRIKAGGRVEGKICNRDNVRIELSKRDLNTKVGMKFGDKRYQFPAGGKGNKRVNGWYRKYFTVNWR